MLDWKFLIFFSLFSASQDFQYFFWCVVRIRSDLSVWVKCAHTCDCENVCKVDVKVFCVCVLLLPFFLSLRITWSPRVDWLFDDGLCCVLCWWSIILLVWEVTTLIRWRCWNEWFAPPLARFVPLMIEVTSPGFGRFYFLDGDCNPIRFVCLMRDYVVSYIDWVLYCSFEGWRRWHVDVVEMSGLLHLWPGWCHWYLRLGLLFYREVQFCGRGL